ncbi:uncharacterized protein LOC100841492 isoform X2 [Brachypodium distachyon]|uniref:Late embryogenesis abundant protein LEA-2 subgroup domain-containing protein n=1 Tax=Brachypodium distachyon TaxID=15368 RepID=I1H1I9_BRADI|nr:uncharacterized protein LOC100841492 isoform X2 [Brachypodium distachyon]KQK19836.1 hypothetical protein BRADI_1g50750v3 [Brachypodium distachyon]|eukprot:XP_010228086.1 uncharacterized protein LOC100841492 isoform X2 [Brachypodium distachyon]
MAAGDDDVDATEKSTFRCLDAARWVVAAAVMVVIVAVTAYAFKVVFRPGTLSLSIVGGSVAVERIHGSNSSSSSNASSSSQNLTFTYSLHAMNPSGRIRIYYTNIRAKLKAINSTKDDNSFLFLRLPDVALAPQSAVDTFLKMTTAAKAPFQEEYFRELRNGTSIGKAWIELNGTLVVENFSGHNMTPVTSTLYYCWPIVVLGGDEDDDSGGTAGSVTESAEEKRP